MHFNYWRQVLAAKLERIQRNKVATEAVKQEDMYNAATEQDRQEFANALRLYGEVSKPANHARCLAALLSYAAGMVCFACEVDWDNKVQFKGRHVIRVDLSENTCTELWASCETFAELTKYLRQAVLDSELATRQTTPIEHLGMFNDQQALCDWAHDVLALHPFTTPGEAVREAAPPPTAIGIAQASAERRLEDSNATNQDSNQSDAKSNRTDLELNHTDIEKKPQSDKVETFKEPEQYDAIKAGRASGFDISWGGVMGSNTNRRLTGKTGWFAAIALAHVWLL